MMKFNLQLFAETNKETFVRQMNELADAINTKTGSSGSLTIAGMKTAVEGISTGVDLSNYYDKDQTDNTFATKEEVTNAAGYASKASKGTARIWTTTEDGKTVLNISTED